MCTLYRFWNITPTRAKPLTKSPTSTAAPSAIFQFSHTMYHEIIIPTMKQLLRPHKAQNPDRTPIYARDYTDNFIPDLKDAHDLDVFLCLPVHPVHHTCAPYRFWNTPIDRHPLKHKSLTNSNQRKSASENKIITVHASCHLISSPCVFSLIHTKYNQL